MSGSPSSASIAAKRRFVGFQPIVLNASRTPTDWLPELVAASVVASICERFVASTVTSPAVASTVLESTNARAPLRMRFVVITALMASEVPCAVPRAAARGRDRAVGERADQRPARCADDREARDGEVAVDDVRLDVAARRR